ncbi:hypothetical protein ACOMHN_039733 [Nucella lapillus]
MDPDPDEHTHPGQEDLRWGSGVKAKELKKGSAPSAKYNKLSEQARRLIAGESQCAMFCGGKKCKYCTADNWKPQQMVITGLYSEWVTDNILAMARPSNHSLDKYNILDQFQEKGVKTVINLQQPGEHASCGYGNDSSGFSYNPQRLMEKEIFFYNFAWQDYGIASMSTLMDIVKVMQFGVAMGKVAVHCHAGLGRTGLLIACYLVYNNRMKAGEAVHYVRSRRPGAIQTSQQVQTVLDFETHLKPFRTIFPSKVVGESEVCFKHFLNRQTHLLHGFEARRLKHIPKVIYVCCERLLQLAGQEPSLSKAPVDTDSIASLPSPSHRLSHISSKDFPVRSSTFSKLLVNPSDSEVRVVVPDKARSSFTLEDLSNSRFKKVLTMGNEEDDSSSSCGEGNTSREVFREGGITSQKVFMNNSEGIAQSPVNVKGGKENEEEDDDDDCIVFGKPDFALPPKDQSQQDSRGHPQESKACVGQEEEEEQQQQHNSLRPETPTLVLNDVWSNPSSITDRSDRIVSPSSLGPGPTLAKVWSLDNDNEDSSVRNSSTNHQPNPTQKRKGKKKGLGERFKNRANKKNNMLSSEAKLEVVDSDERSSKSGSGGLSSSEAASECGSSRESSMVGSSRNIGGVVCTGSSTGVSEAVIALEYPSDVRKKVDRIEKKLNQTDQAWQLLEEEEDPYVLSAVYWDWLNQLKEPVLRKQDLMYLLERTESPKECLHHLEKSVKYFIEYQAIVLSKLFPLPQDLETRLVECLLSHLTHQSVTLSLTFTPAPSQPSHWGEMRSSEALRLIEFFFKLVEEVSAPREQS